MADSSVNAIPEKLGSFYLGSAYDLSAGTVTDPQIHYDARDLTTHAVCVGMTGSGKTGLCVGLLEEAALDRIPAIVIDPKGDMGNLLLHFPDLRPEDFRPWVNPDDARRKGVSPEEFARSSAKLWRNGLLEWGITPERIRALANAVKYEVYTPGSDSVRPVNILGSLRAPGESDAESLREQIAGTVGAILELIGVDADPVQSREAILLSVLFDHYWKNGTDIDLGLLVRSVQDPPVRTFGVFDVDAFLPEQDRFELAMSINNLMAAPSFSPWLSGAALDINSLLYAADGTAKHSIFYIAHLNDAERMFFVTLLLNTLVTWMRQQPGTTSLRALLYFDEAFGFLPPVAVPPSKPPLLTLLKQARAFGLGTVLVTQNPADLDYKALSNTGTWFIGRLQSRQDQQRLLDGLKTATVADASSAASLSETIAQLKSRVFLLHNVHDSGPVVFHTRWVMNYLRGPLTRHQLQQIAQQSDPSSRAVETSPRPSVSHQAPASRPALPPGLEERFLPIASAEEASDHPGIVYRSAVGALATTHFIDRKYDVSTEESTLHILSGADSTSDVDWGAATTAVVSPDFLQSGPASSGASFAGGLPAACNTKVEARKMSRQLEDWLYHNRRFALLFSDELNLCQRPDETTAAFHNRLELAARERRDQAIDEISERFQDSVERVQDRRERLARSRAEQEEQYSARKQEELLTLGETVLGFVLGRRRRLTGVASKRRMTSTARRKLETLDAKDEDLQEEIEQLESAAKEEIEAITHQWDKTTSAFTTRSLAPRRTDVNVHFVGVLWLPYRIDPAQGLDHPAYDFG